MTQRNRSQTVEAQIYAFTAELPEEDQGARVFFCDHASTLAKEPTIAALQEKASELTSESDIRPERNTAEYIDEYDDFLDRRLTAKSDTPPQFMDSVEYRLGLMENYDLFADAVAPLVARSIGYDVEDFTVNDPQIIGQGSVCNVFRLELDGAEYAVRHQRRLQGEYTIDEYVAGTQLVQGRGDFEQLSAVDYRSGVTIAPEIQGTQVALLLPGQAESITDAHLTGLLESLKFAAQRGVSIDPTIENIIFSEESGYRLLDFSRQTYSKDSAPDVGSILQETIGLLTYDLLALQGEYLPYHQEWRRSGQALIDIIIRWQAVIEEGLAKEEGVDVDALVTVADTAISRVVLD